MHLKNHLVHIREITQLLIIANLVGSSTEWCCQLHY